MKVLCLFLRTALSDTGVFPGFNSCGALSDNASVFTLWHFNSTEEKS